MCVRENDLNKKYSNSAIKLSDKVSAKIVMTFEDKLKELSLIQKQLDIINEEVFKAKGSEYKIEVQVSIGQVAFVLPESVLINVSDIINAYLSQRKQTLKENL